MKLLKIAAAVLCLTGINVFAQGNPCLVPGNPSCSRDDFDRALLEQRQGQMQQRQYQLQQQQLQIQQQQLYEMQRSNQIMEQQLMNPAPQPMNSWQQRCFQMPLLTPGC